MGSRRKKKILVQELMEVFSLTLMIQLFQSLQTAHDTIAWSGSSFYLETMAHLTWLVLTDCPVYNPSVITILVLNWLIIARG
jgi:hypothetical protein